MPKDSLTVVDNRTGISYELPISDGTVRASTRLAWRSVWRAR